jgi:hypothetical protein
VALIGSQASLLEGGPPKRTHDHRERESEMESSFSTMLTKSKTTAAAATAVSRDSPYSRVAIRYVNLTHPLTAGAAGGRATGAKVPIQLQFSYQVLSLRSPVLETHSGLEREEGEEEEEGENEDERGRGGMRRGGGKKSVVQHHYAVSDLELYWGDLEGDQSAESEAEEDGGEGKDDRNREREDNDSDGDDEREERETVVIHRLTSTRPHPHSPQKGQQGIRGSSARRHSSSEMSSRSPLPQSLVTERGAGGEKREKEAAIGSHLTTDQTALTMLSTLPAPPSPSSSLPPSAPTSAPLPSLSVDQAKETRAAAAAVTVAVHSQPQIQPSDHLDSHKSRPCLQIQLSDVSLEDEPITKARPKSRPPPPSAPPPASSRSKGALRGEQAKGIKGKSNLKNEVPERQENKTMKKKSTRSSPSVPLEGTLPRQQQQQPSQRHVISLTIDPESPTKK